MSELFSKNKIEIRKLDLKLIKRFFSEGTAVYFGLPSQEMSDILCWKDYISKIYAVEFGSFITQTKDIRQHNLILTAMKNNLSQITTLYCGDIDIILLDRTDEHGQTIQPPFDIVNLDYSSSLTEGKHLDAIKALFKMQKDNSCKKFILFISVNMNHARQLTAQYFNKAISQSTQDQSTLITLTSIVESDHEEIRLKAFLLSQIEGIAAFENYKYEVCKPIYYEGNRHTQMMHFQFILKLSDAPIQPPINKQSIIRAFEKPMLTIADGVISNSTF